MSQAGPATACASNSVSKKRSLWKRATNDISSMICSSPNRKSVESTICLDGEAEQDLDLSELLEELGKLARPGTRPALTFLRQLFNQLEGYETITCLLNKMLLKANVELRLERKYTAQLNFRATNALHLSGSELQVGKVVSFEASLVDDGILFTNLEGLSVSVTVLKGTFRCDVLQARLQNTGGQCILRIKTRNPLIGTTSDDLSQVDLEADVSRNASADAQTEESKQDQLLERRAKARLLRSTTTGMKAFDVTINRVAQQALGLGVPEPCTGPRSRFECLKTIITIYAFSLFLVASYFYLMTKVPQIVPIAMTLSAISLFVLGCERQWTYKSDFAVLLNTFSMIVVTICLYQIF